MGIGYKLTKAGPDVRIRPAAKSDGFEYYEMFLCYQVKFVIVSYTQQEEPKEQITKKE
jgi:hypothetical protein